MQTYTMYVYKKDKRTKSGERFVSITVCTNRSESDMEREVIELQNKKYHPNLFRIAFYLQRYQN